MTRSVHFPARTLAAIGLIACSADPRVGVETGTHAETVSISSCCPETDAEIRTLIARYEATPPAERPPELAMLHHRFAGGFTAAARLVIRDADTWRSVWARIVEGSGPPVPVPGVDFGREMLIFAAMGARSSGGYGIVIDSVTRNGGGLTAWIRERSPGRTCGTTAAVTEPISLARLPRTTAPVTFREKQEVRECQ